MPSAYKRKLQIRKSHMINPEIGQITSPLFQHFKQNLKKLERQMAWVDSFIEY